jgi:MFS superfamily sulfate permease-like transporter
VELLGNRFDKAEFAGAFGDLGTFIPFVVGYITILGMDPLGILVAFGITKILVGIRYRTPMPVQPMKAIGGYAIAHPGAVTSGMIWGAGIFTAFLWSVLALIGAADYLYRITAKPIVRGIMLGLGISFIIDGVGMMGESPYVAVLGLVLTFLFLSNSRIPAMLLLLAFGFCASLLLDPTLLREVAKISPHFRLPSLTLGTISWSDLLVGTLLLAIPQAPLTLGNAVIGVAEENNQLFPDRKVEVRTLAFSHGLMNFFTTAIGGVPLCHGAGGMAGHVRFGARTGGALIILGSLLIALGLFFSDSVLTLLAFFPRSILGVILFFTGLELASIIRDIGKDKGDVYVMAATAGLAIIHMGLAFLLGLTLYYAIRRGIVRV